MQDFWFFPVKGAMIAVDKGAIHAHRTGKGFLESPIVGEGLEVMN